LELSTALGPNMSHDPLSIVLSKKPLHEGRNPVSTQSGLGCSLRFARPRM
jgi:hypothetical protein